MLITRRRTIPALGCLLAVLLMGGVLPAAGQTTAGDTPELLIKIRDIDRVLQDLEAFMPADATAAASPQTAMLKGMLQGTDWIDPSRSLVAGMTYDGQTTSWLVFVPFQAPNENFQNAYGAMAGEDYYVLRFPPAPEMVIPDDQRALLEQESIIPSEAGISVAIAAHDLLLQSEPQIEAAIHGMAASAATQNPQSLFTPEEIRPMVRDFMATLKQVDTLRIGMNADPDALILLLDIEAVKESYLAGLLTDQKARTRLADYQPDYPMQFNSRPYNVTGVMQMLGASFGKMYNQMGLDFDELAEIAKGVTGEMAGGMGLDSDGMTFEMIYVLHDAVNGDEYLTTVYLPWFENYNRRMAALMEKQNGRSVTPLYERMPDTTIDGKKVIGVKTRYSAMRPVGSQMAASPVLQEYQTRMTAVDGLILVASSDAIIAKMLAGVGDLAPTPPQGPLARFSMDIGAYLRGIQSLMPESGPALEIPDDIGALAMTADMQSGELKTRTTINVQDIQKVATLLASLEAAVDDDMALSGADGSLAQTDTIEEPPAPKPEVQNTPAFWMDRGGLLSAYGNYFGAVVSYRKALELSPDLAEAHFQQGVAYGELGRYDAAISAITRAIDLRPSNGAYFYGRARVYLRAGDEDLAMKDFMEAGFLGDDDARAYLKGAGVEWN